MTSATQNNLDKIRFDSIFISFTYPSGRKFTFYKSLKYFFKCFLLSIIFVTYQVTKNALAVLYINIKVMTELFNKGSVERLYLEAKNLPTFV